MLPLGGKLYKVAYRIVGDEDVAKDMVQDTYAAMWNKRDSMEQLDNVESYVMKMLKNRCIDYMRKERIHVNIEDETFNVPSVEVTTEESYDSCEKLSRVMQMMNRLPEQQKKVLLMRSVSDMELEEIEQITGLSNVNVRTLLSRARKRLKELCVEEINR